MPVVTQSKIAPQSSLPLRWLDNYGDGLYAYALRRVRRSDVAEDLVQETLLAGMEAFSKFSGRASVKTWLTGILRHKVSDHLRARYKNEKIEGCTLDDDAMFTRRGRWKVSVPSWNIDPQKQAELSELRSVLDGCVSKLPARMAHLFLSRAHDQISTTDLCSELQITPENAWALLHRARSRLQQCVTTNWFSEPTTSKQQNKQQDK